MNFAAQHDIGAWIGHAPGIASTAQTAGAEAEIDGKVFDREATLNAAQAAGSKNRFQSVAAIIQAQVTMASGNTFGLSANFQDSPNNSDWTDYGDALANTTVISAAGGAVTAKAATIAFGVDLANASRYVRAQVLPNFSATGTDTGVLVGVLVFGGADNLPTDAVSPIQP